MSKVLDEIRDIIGDELFFKMINELGGFSFYIPKEIKNLFLTDDMILIKESIGEDGLRKLIKAKPSTVFYIPKKGNEIEVNLFILRLKKAGYTNKQLITALVNRYDITHRAAKKRIKKLENLQKELNLAEFTHFS